MIHVKTTTPKNKTFIIVVQTEKIYNLNFYELATLENAQ